MSITTKEKSAEMPSKVDMDLTGTPKGQRTKIMKWTTQELEQQRWEENEMSGNRQQRYVAEGMSVRRRKRSLDELDGEEQEVLAIGRFRAVQHIESLALSSETFSRINENEDNGGLKNAATQYIGETTEECKEDENNKEELQDVIQVEKESDSFKKDELHRGTMICANARENLKIGTSPTPNGDVDIEISPPRTRGDQLSAFLEAVEEASLIRLNDELMRMRDPDRLSAFLEAIMACDRASLRAANMSISEDSLLSFDVRALSTSLRLRFHEICFGYC